MSRLALHRLAVVVLVVGLLLTVALVTLSRVNYLRNEQRLVTAQTQLTGTTLAAAPIDVSRRLESAVQVVAATQDPMQFEPSLTSALAPAGRYASVLLFTIVDGTPRLLLTVGQPPMLSATSPQAEAIVGGATTSDTLQVTRLVDGTNQRIGYALSARGPKGTYVGYAEQILPANRRLAIPATSPLRGSDFALYFGPSATPSALIATNSARLPLEGIKATTTVPFGSSSITLTLSPRGSLLGRFAQFIWLAIAIGGTLFTVFVTVLAERLVRGRTVAEELAAVSRRLYQAERSVAETLQHALLPRQLPDCPELEIAVRYLPGTEGIEVGGDWYDVVRLDAQRVFFTIGDVSGRGLDAAILMGTLRTAINAYAVEGQDPGVILGKAGRLVDIALDGRFATILCGRIDLGSGVAELANAGHPGPVLVTAGRSEVVPTDLGPPIGLGHTYATTRVRMAAGSTLVGYTDGLVERRGESITVGLERLRRATEAARSSPSVEALLDAVLADLIPQGPSDDVAVLGIRWRG